MDAGRSLLMPLSIDIDDLFDEDQTGVKTEIRSPEMGKNEANRHDAQQNSHDQTEDAKPDVTSTSTPRAKPKKGRLVSNEAPLEDFTRLIEGEGDVFRKAIQDLGQVVKENIEKSFSRQAFPLAIECLQTMRQTSLTYEEVETYNE